MKRFFSFLITFLIVVVVGSLIYNRFANRQIETETTIEAPVSEVWAVFAEQEAFQDWNPFIKDMAGPMDVGETLSVSLQMGDNNPMTFEPVVLASEPGKEFRWKGKLLYPGIFDGEHYFLFEEVDSTQTRFIQGEEFSGVFSGIISTLVLKDTEAAMEAMNQALKERVQTRYNTNTTAGDSLPPVE